MADILVGRVTAAANTSTGNQTFTDSNFGDKSPKLAIFEITSVLTDSTLTVHNRWGMGAATASNQACARYLDEDAVGTTNAVRSGETSFCIAISITNAASVEGEASWVSFTTNSVTINWTNALTNAYLVNVRLYGGDDFQGHVSTPLLSSSQNGTVEVDAGFAVECGELIYNDTDLDDVSDTFARRSVGYFNNTGGIPQSCLNFDSQDNNPSSSIRGRFDTSRAAFSVGGNEGVEVENFGATTYDLKSVITGIGERIIAVSMNVGGVGVDVGTFTTPTVAGTQTITTTFEPGMVTANLSNIITANATDSSGNAGTWTQFCMDANGSVSVCGMSEDGAGTSNTGNYQEINRFISYTDDVATVKYEAAASIISTGFELDYDDGGAGKVDASARHVVYMAIEKGDGGAPATTTSKLVDDNPLLGHKLIGGTLVG